MTVCDYTWFLHRAAEALDAARCAETGCDDEKTKQEIEKVTIILSEMIGGYGKWPVQNEK